MLSSTDMDCLAAPSSLRLASNRVTEAPIYLCLTGCLRRNQLPNGLRLEESSPMAASLPVLGLQS